MKQFEIKIQSNVNIPFLTKLIEKLRLLGCIITDKNGNIHIEYDDDLEPKIQELFKDL